MEFKKYHSIEQFRNTIKHVQDTCKFKSIPLPKIDYIGYVKLHGTNATIQIDVDNNKFIYGSKNHELSIHDDNCGFMNYFKDKEFIFNEIVTQAKDDNFKEIRIYGEWVGKGIQKGAAISQIEKSFIIFQIEMDDLDIVLPKETEIYNDNRVYFINQFKIYEIEIDFNNPQFYQNTLIKYTEEVENQCPAGKYFGIEGIGEGIVWSPKCSYYDDFNQEKLVFKVKGEKHSVTKVKKLASVDIEMINSIQEFCNNTVTENRLNQGLDYFKEMNLDIDIKNLSIFIKWVCSDISKEEIDTIEGNNLPKKVVMQNVSKMTREFFIKFLQNN